MKRTVHFLFSTLILSLSFFYGLTIFSCRKADIVPQEQAALNNAVLTQRFFNHPATIDTSVSRVINILRAQPALIPSFIGLNGWAVWDKAVIYHQQKNNMRIDSASDKDYDMVLIPIVKDSSKQVKAMLACGVAKNGSVLIRLVKAADYKWFDAHSALTGLNGRELSVFFMRLDQLVFGHKRFTINDSTLFKHADNKFAIGIQLESVNSVTTQNRLDEASSNLKYVSVCSSVSTTEAIPVKNGQLFGCPPDRPCVQYETHNVLQCIWVWLSPDDPLTDSGGGIGIPLPGGSGPGSDGSNPFPFGQGYFDPCDPNLPAPPAGSVYPPCNQATLMPWEPDGLTTGNEFYILTQADQKIWDEINAEDAAADLALSSPKDCQGTNRTGNIQWAGTLEHWMIMIDYVIRNPLAGQIEYQIPNAGIKNGRPGYADIVNTSSGDMFEIKPPGQATPGKDEVAKYVAMAAIGCPRLPGLPMWHQGTDYATRFLPNPRNPLKQIKVTSTTPGVIIYEDVPGGNPVPLVIPMSVLDKIKSLVEKLKNTPQTIEVAIAQFLNDPANADLVSTIKTAAISTGVAIIVGTIIEDFLTAGIGIADDWASFMLAMRIIKFAVRLP